MVATTISVVQHLLKALLLPSASENNYSLTGGFFLLTVLIPSNANWSEVSKPTHFWGHSCRRKGHGSLGSGGKVGVQVWKRSCSLFTRHMALQWNKMAGNQHVKKVSV